MTLITGMTGSGKSTFALRYLVNAAAACCFIFDDLGRAATRLGVNPCYTAHQIEAALATRRVIFNPWKMFDDGKMAFRWFCQWVYDASVRGPGKKLFLVDEIWQWQTNQQIPPELAKVAQAGREENIELVCATQLPHRINASITGQTTELVCFRLNERLALDCIADLGAAREKVSQLPLGSFLSYNRLLPGSLAGKVF
ncbi:MAG TPA: hypothetical protein VHH88_02190 [Verrucomicrobiae bacterium]|nr:hypothetical protein [Verrucomicrobiae bacterium]